MDIAEIRKKARTGKSKTSPSVPAKGQESAALTNSTISVVQEPERAMDRPQEPRRSADVVALSAITQDVQRTEEISPAQKSTVAEYRDSIEQLFSWSPETEVASIDSYGGSIAAGQEQTETDCRQWLAFMLGAEEYSLDIVSIREIIKPRDITDIPRVPGFLLGIISLRGNIIPIFDLKRRLHLGESQIDNYSRIIVCQEGERFAGLLVDRISQVVSMPALNIEPPPAILTGIDRELVGGVGRLQGKMMILLHLSSVLNIELV